MRRIGRIDKFRRPNVNQACTRFLLNSTGPFVSNGVCENELVKTELFESEIHYRLTASVINPRPQYFRASQSPRFSGVPGRQSSKQPMTSVGLSFKHNPQLHRLIPCGGRSTF